MKKIICLLTVFSFFSLLSFLAAEPVLSAVNPSAVSEAEIIAPQPTDMIHFTMNVQWGNVQGEVENKAETNFNGSISASSAAKVSLIRTLLFEAHNATADLVTSNMNPVSWNSLIYRHWDGVRVMVSAPAGESITVLTAQGSVTKTAKEFYEAKTPIVQDVGNGKEIIIKTYPTRRHAFVMKLIWGKTDRADYSETIECATATDANALSAAAKTRCLKFPKENFSGSLTLSGEAKMKLVRALRFEGDDSIISQGDGQISWDSTIWGGVDGVLVKFVLDKAVSNSASVTLSFPEQKYSKSISLTDLYHKRIIKDEIKSGYGVYASVWSFPNRTLIKAKNNDRVFMLEDGLKRHIPNPRVFEDQGLKWGDIEEVEPDEIDVLPEADPLSYSEGTLIKGDGNDVYAISNDEKRKITSIEAFEKLKYNWKNIIKVDNAELALYTNGELIGSGSDFPDSTLLKVVGSDAVYIKEGDKLRPITSPEAFESNNLRWDRIKTISAGDKNKYIVGNVLGLGDGVSVKEPSGNVYQIDQGKKRLIRSAADFEKAGLDWKKVVSVTTAEANNFTSGEDIVSDDLR